MNQDDMPQHVPRDDSGRDEYVHPTDMSRTLLVLASRSHFSTRGGQAAQRVLDAQMQRDQDVHNAALQREIDTNERLVAQAQATRPESITASEEYDYLTRECIVCHDTKVCPMMLTRSDAAYHLNTIHHGGRDYPICECGPVHLVCVLCARGHTGNDTSPIQCTLCRR